MKTRLAVIYSIILLIASNSQAAVLTVNSYLEGTPGNALCEFAEAILSANTDTPTDGCPAGSGADIIILPPGTYLLNFNPLPVVASDVTIQSEGATISRLSTTLPYRILEIQGGANVVLDRLIITGGDAIGSEGGGILVNDGRLTVINSSIIGNSAVQGGGISCVYSGDSATVIDSAIFQNTASGGFGGGGIFCSNVTVSNSTLADNVVSGTNTNGGGIVADRVLTIVNSTLAGNTASGTSAAGGGFFSASPAGAWLINSIIADNIASTGPDCFAIVPFVSQGHNLINDATGCPVTAGSGDLFNQAADLDAFFDDGSPGNGHFPLLSTSLARDAGDDAMCPPLDQLGAAREGICDIGAVEFGASAPATPPILSLFPSILSFPGTPVGETSEQTLQLRNQGGSDLQITSVTLSGAQSANFAVEEDRCAGQTLNPQDACEVLLSFTPNQGNTFNTDLDILTNAAVSPQTITLTGLGIEKENSDSGCSLGTRTSSGSAKGFGWVFIGGVLLFAARMPRHKIIKKTK